MPFNICDWRWTDAIEQIKIVKDYRPLVIHLRSVYLQGLLFLRNSDYWRKANCTNSDVIFEWLDSATTQFGRDSIQDLCIAFVNTLDWVDGIIIGMETYDQLLENLMLFSKDPLTVSQYEELIACRPYISERTLNPSLWSVG